MVIDQYEPQEIRYDMLRQIPNDKSGPHYELLPQNKSLILVPIMEQAQNAQIYWNHENNTMEPLYGTLMKTKGELPRIELFNNQIDKGNMLLEKYTVMNNEETVLDLARTLLIKSYDELIQSIKPKRQGQNILQIYNEELLKKIANDEYLNPTESKKQTNKKLIMSAKDLMIDPERSSPQFEIPSVQRDLSEKKISSRQQNHYSLPMIEIPTKTQMNRPLPQYFMLGQAEELLPTIRNHVMQSQINVPPRESTPESPKIRPTVSENHKSLPQTELLQTQTKLSANLLKDLKNTDDKLITIPNKVNITKTDIFFTENSILIPRDKLLDITNHSNRSVAKDNIIVQQFENLSWPNKSISFESNNTVPYRTINHAQVQQNKLSITQSRRAQDSQDYVRKSKTTKPLEETIIRQNVLNTQNIDSKSVVKELQELALADVVHVKDSGEHVITNSKSLQYNELLGNQIYNIDNKKTDENILEETQLYKRRHGEQVRFNDDSKLCRLKGGKLICDVPIVRSILKKPLAKSLLSEHQMSVNVENESTHRLKLNTKQKPKDRHMKVKKVRTSVKDEVPRKHPVIVQKLRYKEIFKNFINNRIPRVQIIQPDE